MASRRSGFVALLCLVAVAAGAGVAEAQLWPVPKSMQSSGGPVKLSPTFVFASSTKNANLQDAIARYNGIISKLLPAADDVAGVPVLVNATIQVTGHDNSLNQNTDYSYLLEVSPKVDVVTIQSKTVFGAMYGMETFTQLVSNGECQHSYVYIQDSPMYRHRGTLVDSGRRFAPVSMLQSIMDAMSYSKMNVLHLHLSDWGGFRLQVPGYSELTDDLDGQYYTKADAAKLTDYAVKRGIRLIPEVDLPSHSGCFAPLIPKGLEFCDSSNELIKNTPTNLAILTKVVTAVMDAFPFTNFVHLGGDETVPQGGCTWDDIHAIEEHLQAVVTANHKLPIVWNEVFSDPSLSTAPNGALNTTTIQNWERSSSATTTKMGFGSVSSEYKTQYLDQECCQAGAAAITTGDRMRQCYYADIAENVPTSSRALLYGGEVCLWTDLYCPKSYNGVSKCPNEGQFAWMYPPSQDATYTSSAMGLMWPRSAGTAGALWNYDPSLSLNTTGPYADAIAAHNSRLIARGVDSCPNGCTCSWGYRCGKAYGAVPPYPLRAELTNTCDFEIKVRERTPCSSTTGTTLAVIQPGESYTVTTDFLVEGGKDPLKVGDPWGEWIGGGSWRDLVLKLNVSYSSSLPTYLAYTQTYPTPP